MILGLLDVSDFLDLTVDGSKTNAARAASPETTANTASSPFGED